MIDSQGYLAFSPDGRTLAAGYPVEDKTEGTLFILLRFYRTDDWTIISEVKAAGGSLLFSPDGALVVVKPRKGATRPPFVFGVVNVADGSSKHRFAVRDGTDAVFLGDRKLAVGGASRAPQVYVTSSGERKRMDVSESSINIFDLTTGCLWGRMSLRNVRAIAALPNGRGLITGKDKFLNDGAALQKWKLDNPSRLIPYDDEFQLYRQIEFRENQVTSRDNSHAPALMKADIESLQIGMSYDEVEAIVLGRGRMAATIVERDQKMDDHSKLIRAVVTYDAVSENEPSQCQLTFEGDLYGPPASLKLVAKRIVVAE